MLPCFRAIAGAVLEYKKQTTMNSQNSLRISLSAVLSLLFLVFFLETGAAVSKVTNHATVSNHEVKAADISPKPGNFNLAVPDMIPQTANRPRENSNHQKGEANHKTINSKHHPDEEKHDNHFYHYDWLLRRNKWYCNLLCFILKIFVAITYLSVLICGYLSICH